MTQSFLEQTSSLGQDAGNGNLLGVQTVMRAADYTSQAAFSHRLDSYLAEAAHLGWINAKTVVIFPEYSAVWLVLLWEAAAVLRARTVVGGSALAALAHPLQVARAYRSATEKSRISAAIFRMKAATAARAYQDVFAALAQKYAVTLVAGSIILPDPHVKDGIVQPGQGPLYNTCAVFDPQGCAYPHLVRKVFPIEDELPFVTPAPVADLPVFETPAGRLGVLICADSWYPEPYARLKEQAAGLIAVPSYLNGPKETWDQPWRSYSGDGYVPADVDSADANHLSEGQAWRKYSLRGRMASCGARCGLNVFGQVDLWDLGANGGRSCMGTRQEWFETDVTGAALLNLWL